MNKHNIDEQLDQLARVKKVEAPPFLLTRIEARLAQLKQLRVKPLWAWAIGFGLVSLIGFQLFVMGRQLHTPRGGRGNAAPFNYLLPNNSLYN